jgi:pyruvate,water dikinase
MTARDASSTGTKTDSDSTLQPLVVELTDVVSADVKLVGSKGADLGNMLGAGFPVSTGFVVTAAAYARCVGEAGVAARLASITEEAAMVGPEKLTQLSREAQRLVADVAIPDDLVETITEVYARSCAGHRVAVRSSATSEDTAETSFAGMNESFTNVRAKDLVQRVTDCWVSLFGEQLVAYRAEHGLLDEPAIAVVVQQMVSSDRSGAIESAGHTT